MTANRRGALTRTVPAFLLAFGWCVVAFAAPAALVTIRSVDTTDPAPYELRLRSELAAEGIDAIVANAAGGEPKQLASRFGANCVVEVTVSEAELNATVWIADPTLSLEVTRSLRTSNRQRDPVGVFALRTVDFLLGARLELEQQRRAKLAQSASNSTPTPAPSATPKSEPAPSPAPSKPKATSESPSKEAPSKSLTSDSHMSSDGAASHKPPAAPTADRFRIDAAYSILVSSSHFVWATAPVVAIQWFPRDHWGVGVTLAAPFVNHLDATSGTYRVTVDQELLQVVLRGQWSMAGDWFVEPHLGVGLSRYAANGAAANPPDAGVLASAWSVFTVGGLDLAWRWGRHLRWITGATGIVRWQNPVVVIEGEQRTGNSRWNLLVKTGPGWSF